MKTRAHHEAARNDRPGEWTCDDVEGARLQANETARPWGAEGPTPDQSWYYHRAPLNTIDRELFAEEVARRREGVRARRGCLPGFEPSADEKASIDREAVSRSLMELGYLKVRRRRIPLRVRDLKVKKIS